MCQASKINLFIPGKLKLPLRNWLSTQWIHHEMTVNLLHKYLCSMLNCPLWKAKVTLSGSQCATLFKIHEHSILICFSRITVMHRSRYSWREPDAQYQQWTPSLRWCMYPRHAGTWRVSNSLGWINPGDFLIPPTMHLGRLHCICGKGIHNQYLIACYRLQQCYDYERNT